MSTSELLAPLQDSILNKPHYFSGMLQLPSSSFSLFYRLTKDGHASRYEGWLSRKSGRASLTLYRRHIDLANATFNELDQLAQACQPTSLSVVEEGTTNEPYCKVRKMDSGCYASVLAPDKTGLGKFIGDYLFEDSQTSKSQSKIEMVLQEFNVYSEYLIPMINSNPVEINALLSSGFFL
jgi:hypothetical protein